MSCVVCYAEEVPLFHPFSCGHECICKDCFTKLLREPKITCPLCRSEFDRSVYLHLTVYAEDVSTRVLPYEQGVAVSSYFSEPVVMMWFGEKG